MKKLLIVAALLAASPAHAGGFGMALAGMGAVAQQRYNPDLYEREEERRYQREALWEQQRQTQIMEEQLNRQRWQQPQPQPPVNYYGR